MRNFDLDNAVNRFLTWRLPQDFSPDAGISFDRSRQHSPVGTNLLTATQAREMLRHVLAGQPGKCLFAFTPGDPVYPPYLNLSATAIGEINVVMRASARTNEVTGHPDVGAHASITLPLTEAAKLHAALGDFLKETSNA